MPSLHPKMSCFCSNVALLDMFSAWRCLLVGVGSKLCFVGKKVERKNSVKLWKAGPWTALCGTLCRQWLNSQKAHFFNLINTNKNFEIVSNKRPHVPYCTFWPGASSIKVYKCMLQVVWKLKHHLSDASKIHRSFPNDYESIIFKFNFCFIELAPGLWVIWTSIWTSMKAIFCY